MRDTSARRRQIRKAAAALFVEKGFDGTTFIKVSKASRTAVGSITHFFVDKGGLAAAVYDDTMGELAADARAALRGHGADVPAAIHGLLSACLTWDKRFPHHRRLLGMLEQYGSRSQRSRTDEDNDTLPKVLADWAGPLIRDGSVAPFSPSQLYAVVLAPAMCAATAGAGPTADVRGSSINWLDVLTATALAAIPPRKSQPKPRLKAGSNAKEQGGLI
jgi:AcrR family transcriptional regulator